MGLIELPRAPSERELRWFGCILAAALVMVGAICFKGAPTVAYGFWVAAVTSLVVYYAVPPVRCPLYLAWMYAAYPVGWVLSHVIMAVLYYGCVTPIGLVMRLFRYDPLQLRRTERASHWHQRPTPPPVERYFRQF
jgi:carbamoyltransferase